MIGFARSDYPFKYLLFGLVTLWGCHRGNDVDLTIACASNMQYAIVEITEAFQNSTGISCNVITNSSGKLTALIREGAPYDVFISADLLYPLELQESGHVIGSPIVFAYGSLVWWSMDTSYFELPISPDRMNSIAIANPKTAPYGRAAIEALEKTEWLDELEDKLTFGESIAQTAQFIRSGASDVGIIAKSLVLSETLNGVGEWEDLPSDSYEPIPHAIVSTGNDKTKVSDAKQFSDFLISDKGQEILRKYGFMIPEQGITE